IRDFHVTGVQTCALPISGLKEEVKWGIPVYTHKGKNILSVSALKNHALMGFFKGVLLTDSEKILEKQANILEARVLKFTNVSDRSEERRVGKECRSPLEW